MTKIETIYKSETVCEWSVDNGMYVISQYKNGQYEVRRGMKRFDSFSDFSEAVQYVKKLQPNN